MMICLFQAFPDSGQCTKQAWNQTNHLPKITSTKEDYNMNWIRKQDQNQIPRDAFGSFCHKNPKVIGYMQYEHHN